MGLVSMNFNLHKISFIGAIFVILFSCSIREREPIIPPPCPIEDLIVDISSFPAGWTQNSPPRERNAPIRWGVDKRGVSFSTQEYGGAIQDVYRGRNLDDAGKGYFNLSESWFRLREAEGDWYIPSEFSYESIIADHYRFGCSIHKPSGFQTCQMAAQYGVYVTRFYTGMSPLMTYSDLERILQAIDNKMGQCLGK